MVDGELLTNSEIHITCILKYIGIYVSYPGQLAGFELAKYVVRQEHIIDNRSE